MDNMIPFTKLDWDAFAGAEGDNPHIGYFEIDGQDYTVVADDFGVQISWQTGDNESWMDHFAVKDFCELESTVLTLNFHAMYGNGVLRIAEKADTIEDVFNKCGFAQHQ